MFTSIFSFVNLCLMWSVASWKSCLQIMIKDIFKFLYAIIIMAYGNCSYENGDFQISVNPHSAR